MDEQPLYPAQPQFNPVSPPAPQTPQPIPPTPPHSHRKRLLIIVIASVLTIGVGAACAWYFIVPKTQSCLTRSDYQTITGEALADDAPFTPTIDFYGFDVEFNPEVTNYSDSGVESRLVAIAKFAKQHPKVSLNVTIQGMYTDTTRALATERAATINDLLVKSGMNSKAVASELKAYTPGDSQDETFSEDGNNILSITVASSETCK